MTGGEGGGGGRGGETPLQIVKKVSPLGIACRVRLNKG